MNEPATIGDMMSAYATDAVEFCQEKFDVALNYSEESVEVWPHLKAGKRIVNGPEDNIWHYFRYLQAQAPAFAN